MKLATFIYKRYLRSSGIEKKFWSISRRMLVKLFNDPLCLMEIHKKTLNLPLSHALPDCMNQYPFYDQLPKRVSKYIYEQEGHINCIDVGANIGDSIAAFYKSKTDIFLAIEPNPNFNKILVANWNSNKNVTIISDICSSASSENQFEIHEKNGTASILEIEDGVKMSRKTLDDIVNIHTSAINANILKIDTDGHDFKVIAGAKEILSKNLPAVIFECAVFEDDNYVNDCLGALKYFQQIGYNSFMVYDNYGNLMGKYSFSDLLPFKNLLFFQLTSDFYYFDILVMKDKDISRFYKSEIDYFIDKMDNKSLQYMATTIVE